MISAIVTETRAPLQMFYQNTSTSETRVENLSPSLVNCFRFSAVRYDDDIWMIGGELSGTSEIFHAETNQTEVVEIDNFKPPKGHCAVKLPRHD